MCTSDKKGSRGLERIISLSSALNFNHTFPTFNCKGWKTVTLGNNSS